MFTIDLTGHSPPSLLTNIIRGRERGGDKHVYSVLRYETKVGWYEDFSNDSPKDYLKIYSLISSSVFFQN